MARYRSSFGKIAEVFTLSRSEARGVLLLLPLLAMAGVLIHGLGRKRSDPRFLAVADSVTVSAGIDQAAADKAEPEPPDGLFYFDPNTVTLEELCRLGFELRVAASIVKYRDAGKVFEVPEDLAMCYGVTLEQYLAVEPYIDIGERFRRKRTPARAVSPAGPADRTAPSTADRIAAFEAFDPNDLDEEGFTALGFTAAQARTIVNYRRAVGGFSTAEQFGRCYAVSDQALQRLAPYMVFDGGQLSPAVLQSASGTEDAPELPVELNGADSAALRSVSGIGEVTVMRIMEYRRRLGGFYRREQLAEVQGMTEANYGRIIEQIRVDSCKISKIDINFAPHKELVERLQEHPYTDARGVRKLLSVRQLKGGWSNIRELIDDKILTDGQAEKLAPYLLFRPLDDE